MTLERLRERLNQGLTTDKLGALPATYTWASALRAAFMKHRLINDLMEFPEPQGVVLSGESGNGRHTTASALVNSLGGKYLWLSGWDLDQEEPGDSIEIIRNVVRLAYEQGKLVLLLDGPEHCRHSMLVQECLARLLRNIDAGMLVLVIVTQEADMVSSALRQHLLLCPCAAPTKTERRSWLKLHLEKPVPLKVDGMDLEDLVKKTEGFSWQQLQDLQNHLKLQIFWQLLNRQKELKEKQVTLEEALKAGVVTVSSTAAEVLLNQIDSQNPKAQAMPAIQYISGGQNNSDQNNQNNNNDQGISHEDMQKMIDKWSDPEKMSKDELFDF